MTSAEEEEVTSCADCAIGSASTRLSAASLTPASSYIPDISRAEVLAVILMLLR